MRSGVPAGYLPAAPGMICDSGFNPMSKAVDEILRSINEVFKACGQATEEFEAKSLFRLLNYCPLACGKRADAQRDRVLQVGASGRREIRPRRGGLADGAPRKP
jgi:hypothetical protein